MCSGASVVTADLCGLIWVRSLWSHRAVRAIQLNGLNGLTWSSNGTLSNLWKWQFKCNECWQRQCLFLSVVWTENVNGCFTKYCMFRRPSFTHLYYLFFDSTRRVEAGVKVNTVLTWYKSWPHLIEGNNIDTWKSNQCARKQLNIVENISVIKISVLIQIKVYGLHVLNRPITLTNCSDLRKCCMQYFLCNTKLMKCSYI